MRLRSSAFADGAMIPRRFTWDDQNLSPPLAWTDVPNNVCSFVLLCDDPLLRGHLCLSALEMNEERHIVSHQSPQREDLHCEKVSSHQHREMSPNEFCPCGRSSALRRRRYAVAPQNIADRFDPKPDDPGWPNAPTIRIDFRWPSEPQFLCRLAACPGLDVHAIHRICGRRDFGTTPKWCPAERQSPPRSRWPISASITRSVYESLRRCRAQKHDPPGLALRTLRGGALARIRAGGGAGVPISGIGLCGNFRPRALLIVHWPELGSLGQRRPLAPGVAPARVPGCRRDTHSVIRTSEQDVNKVAKVKKRMGRPRSAPSRS
jgi:hypothetical protein